MLPTDEIFELNFRFKLLLDTFELFLKFTFVSIVLIETEKFLEVSFR